MPAGFRRLFLMPVALCVGFVGMAPHIAAAQAGAPHHGHQPAGQHASATQVAKTPLMVTDAWIRPMVPGQTATGGFMNLTAHESLTLEGFTMDIPGAAELHEMRMDGSVMRMRAIHSLPLPAGQMVALKPGGYHLMLVNLPEPLTAGKVVALTLKLKTKAGRSLSQTLTVPVQHMVRGGMHHAPAHAH